MYRFMLWSAAALPLLADSLIKGTALLLPAVLLAVFMHRASAAARHLMWLTAVVALLALPILSTFLPGWRVLPAWTPMAPAANALPQSTDRDLANP